MGVINQETSLRLSQLVASLLPTGFVHGPYMKQIPTLMEHKRSNLRVSLHMFLFPNISRTQLASFTVSVSSVLTRGLDMVILVQHQHLQQVRGEGNLMP